MKPELQKYIDLDGTGMDEVKGLLTEMSESGDFTDIPVCVLSHMYDPKRSRFLADLVNEERDRSYIIFTYEDQKHLYQMFEELNNVEVHYISLSNPVDLTLSGKRQYIIDYLQYNEIENGFFIEDDCYSFHLPVGGIGGTGNFRNGKYQMSFSMAFSFWEFLIKKFDLGYSGLTSNMAFTFNDMSKHTFIKHNAQCVQAVHINVKDCKSLNIAYDHDSGWDDFDMNIQQVTRNKGTDCLMFGYCTPSLKSGVSAMSSDADKLKERCEINTKALIKKWGLALVREDTKKDLYNAKVNWRMIKTAGINEVPVKDLIGMGSDEAKDYIRNKTAEEKSETIWNW